LADLAKTKKPIAILQRSKPVAYIIDADSFMMLQIKDDNELAETRKKSLEKILHIKERVAQKTGKQEDSVNLIRELREGANRYE
jgi:PHD/YefM family antitoxin component YafN of YafNO toxin-antitoxin module